MYANKTLYVCMYVCMYVYVCTVYMYAIVLGDHAWGFVCT